MKKSMFLFVLLFSSFNALHSQDWFSLDNQWVYRSYGFEYSGFAEAYVLGDTMVNNVSAKTVRFAYSEGNPLAPGILNYEIDRIAYEKNDSVFYLNELNQFALMYDFSMSPGDTMTIFDTQVGKMCQDFTTYHLDSLSVLIQGTDTFRVQHMTFDDPMLQGSFQRDIIEFIGNSEGHYILQNDHPCVFDLGVLRLCSFDNNVSSFKFLDDDVDCYEVITSSKQTLVIKNINIYPNPSDGQLIIEMEETPTQIEVINLKGQTVWTSTQRKRLDLSSLSSGSYFLKIWTDKNYHVEKIMVH